MGSFFIKNRNIDSSFTLFSIFVIMNCFGRYMLAISDSLKMAIWANKFLYVGGCYAPLLTVFLLSRLCNVKISRILFGSLALYSTVVLCLAMTIEKSDLYYKSVSLGTAEGYHYLNKVYGPLHSLYPLMLLLYTGVMIYFMVLAYRKRHLLSAYLVYSICGLCIAIVAAYLLERITGSTISFVSIGYIIGSAFIIKYFERINMYNIVSNISGSTNQANEYGYIIFDNKYRYINSNSLVKQLFPEVENWALDKEVPETDSYLYREIFPFLHQWNGDTKAYKYIKIDEQYFHVTIRPISYQKKACVGYMLEFSDRTLEKNYYNAIEKEVADKTEELTAQQKRTKKLFLQTVMALSDAVEAKDRYTSGHSKRVAEYSRMIAKRLGKNKEEQDAIYRAGLLHDVGKIRIPADIINKPGKLTDEEFDTIKIHPIAGHHILKSISENSFMAVAAKYHHERYDGKGYPNGLSGENIPEIARILGVADSYDAMTSNRSYRKALPQEVVRAEIEKGKGTQFDPQFAEIMLQLIDEDTEYQLKQTDSGQKSILTVDDERMNNKIIAHIMQDEPMYEVCAAESGKEALALMEQQAFDLILLDVKMPEMDGLEVLKRIRANYSTPVVLMTSDKSLDLAVEFSEYGCDDYITKPFLPLLVKEVIHNMTGKVPLNPV